MAGTTYSRTAGTAVNKATYRAVLKRLAPGVRPIDPAWRTDYEAHPELRGRFDHLHQQHRPPPFLEFALFEAGTAPIANYPGAIPGPAHAPDAILTSPREEVARQLGIDLKTLDKELLNFTGPVTLVALPPGTVMYRTVGLLCREGAIAHGSVINAPLGGYWDLVSPNTYASLADWRAATAVLGEWNGDYGHIRATVGEQPLLVLVGRVGPQTVPRTGDPMHLPGGGMQVYAPNLKNEAFAQPIAGQPLKDIVHPTKFGGSVP